MASLEERIETITRTIEHFERMALQAEAVANQRKRPRGPSLNQGLFHRNETGAKIGYF
jgi:hypothetical protein